MTMNRLQPLAAAGALVVMAFLLPPRADAQSIARRVAAVRDGKVRMTFASRPDVCGYPNGISTGFNRNNDNRTSWSPNTSEDVHYDEDCSLGPARVVATITDGRIERVRAYVGGRWRQGTNVTDLGHVSVREATDYLLGIANTSAGKGAGEAIFAATLADSVNIADPLFTLARNQSRPDDVRGQAIFWLSQLPDERAVGMLEDLLRNSRDEDIQDKAIFGLSQHRSGRGFTVLREYAEREGAPEEMRGKAIFWLSQRKSSESGQYLRSLYSRVGTENLKDKVIFALSQQRDEVNGQWLLDLAANTREPVENRKKALFWAGQGGASMDKLAALYGRMTDREMKEQLIFVYSQRRDRAAIDKLMDIARNDPDREMRRKAMFWLGQSRDSRVSAFLSEMINR